MSFQIILGIIAVFFLGFLVFQFRRKRIGLGQFIFFLVGAFLFLIIIFQPDITSYFANRLGIGRGADLAIYLAVVLLFYFYFKLFIRLEKFDRHLTQVVRKIALLEMKEPEDKKGK